MCLTVVSWEAEVCHLDMASGRTGFNAREWGERGISFPRSLPVGLQFRPLASFLLQGPQLPPKAPSHSQSSRSSRQGTLLGPGTVMAFLPTAVWAPVSSAPRQTVPLLNCLQLDPLEVPLVFLLGLRHRDNNNEGVSWT